MTPKEKAYELVNFMLEASDEESMRIAKACSLVCVDEIIKSHEAWSTEQDEVFSFCGDLKHEINIL